MSLNKKKSPIVLVLEHSVAGFNQLPFLTFLIVFDSPWRLQAGRTNTNRTGSHPHTYPMVYCNHVQIFSY
jgi:hypothetical protein